MRQPAAPPAAPPTGDAPADCILCGRCLSVCPLYAATGREELSPKAKFRLAADLASNTPSLAARPASALAELCLGCGRCQKACPGRLHAPDLVGRLRAAHPGWQTALWGAWIKNGRLLWPLAAALARFLPDAAPLAAARALSPAAAPRPWLAMTAAPPPPTPRPVALFPGCVARFARTDWKDKAARLLARLGHPPIPDPGFTCCGAPVARAGLPAAAAATRQTNIAAWRAAGRPALATFCDTCRHGLEAYAATPDFQPGEAQAWLEALTPLAGLLGQATFQIIGEAPETVIYHRPCHAPSDQDAAFPLRTPEARLAPPSQNPCCGFGGLLRLTAPDLSDRVADMAWKTYNAPPGSWVVTGCSGCLTQLAATAPANVTTAHWLDLLARDDHP